MRSRIAKWIAIASAGLILLPLFFLPVWSVASSWTWPSLTPGNWGLRAWKYLFVDQRGTLETLGFSIALSTGVSFATILLCLPAAKALALREFRGKKIVQSILFAPMIIPATTIAMGLHVQMIRMGLANRVLGVFLVHILPCIPYAVFILRDTYAAIGENYELISRNLGATRLQTIRSVSIPMMLPGVLTAAIMCFIVSFSQYFLTYLIGGGQVTTFALLLFPFLQSGDRTVASAMAVLFLLTSVLALWAIHKGISRLTLGRKGESDESIGHNPTV